VVADLSTGRLSPDVDRGRQAARCREESAGGAHEIAVNMFRAWYVPFYCYGAIHGDPHLGNYTIRPDNGLNLFDFAACASSSPPSCKGVIDLYFALQPTITSSPSTRMRSGASRTSQDMIEVLNQWARFVYAPLLDDRQPQDQKRTRVYGRDVAEKGAWECAASAASGPPREFVFMIAPRSVRSVFFHLKAGDQLASPLSRADRRFRCGLAGEAQRAALKAAGLQSP